MLLLQDSEDKDYSDEAIAIMLLGCTLPGFWEEDFLEEQNERVRSANKKSKFDDTDELFENVYFSTDPICSEADFERRFRMPRSVLECINHGLDGRGMFSSDSMPQ